ncbi:MAG: DNA integrity scanning protein DisA nucleotide-binding domain protein [Bryobacterales bacterium]|nr:DNA integrity scanning protein DisA nucleotide-binding domain protein [Bryobacterales bacterium]
MFLFHWQNVVDFLVLAIAFYVLLLWARQARALRTALAIVGMHAGSLLARRFDLIITSWVLDTAAVVALVLLVVVFQPELRYALLRLESLIKLGPRPGAALKAAYQEVADAVFAMAAVRLGALCVIVREDSLEELVTGGVRLNADVSTELLEAIFRKESPLHDGAVIIDGRQILRANGLLPLSTRTDLPLMYGTRHRAAMGLAERCDALVIAVSEERGEVTLMHNREARVVTDGASLVVLLDRLYSRPPMTPQRRMRRAVTAHLGFKLAALGMASTIWIFSWMDTGSTIRSVSLPVEFVNIPRGMDVSNQSTDRLDVQLRGKSWMMDTIGVARLVARFDLSHAHEGSFRLMVTPEVLNLPPGVIIDRVSPEAVRIFLKARVRTKP